MYRQKRLWADNRQHQPCNRGAPAADPQIHRLKTRIPHSRLQVLEWRAIILAVEDNRRLQIACAPRVLEKPAEPLLPSVNREQERAVAAAIRKILGNTSVKTAVRIRMRGRLEFHRIVLLRVG